jgi:uncharacterized protein (DUF58 family)
MSDTVRDLLAEGEKAGQRYALCLPRRTLLGLAGAAVGHRAGSSLEFRDYRDYQPGDDLRHVDWSAYARSDQLSVKLYREEVTPHVDIILDGSRSMDLDGTRKGPAALALSAFFAAAAGNACYSFRAWRIGSAIEPVINGTSSPPLWQGLAFDQRGSPVEALGQVAGRWKPRGARVLVSDLLWEGDPLHVVRHLADRAASVIVVQLLASADDEPSLTGNVRLVDAESDLYREIHISAAVLKRYKEALRRHQENWNQACRQMGAIFAVVIAEKLLADWRLDELVAAEVLKVI